MKLFRSGVGPGLPTVAKLRWLGVAVVGLTMVAPVNAAPERLQEERPVIVLSPGHGWRVGDQIDNGASSGDLIEKDINLDVAKHTRSFLGRCPVDVYLTREGDDFNHTLSDVDEIVNGMDPDLGISIHSNSGDGNPSGTEAWYTVGGFDDANSRRVAALLSENVSDRLQIQNRGQKPETDNRHGGLYIHQWNAPAALIEIAFLQGDGSLLRERRPDFARAIALAVLEYVEIDPACADWAVVEGWSGSTHFPGEAGSNEIQIRNLGIAQWEAGSYTLSAVGNSYGAAQQYPLSDRTQVNSIATFEIPVQAPDRPGVYRQRWQLTRGQDPVGEQITVYIIVVPEAARELRDDIDARLDDLREDGEQEVQEFVDEIERELLEWVTGEISDLECMRPFLFVGLMVGALILRKVDNR